MDSKIETRLKAYQSRENIEIFFDIIGKLINDLGITKDDTRFCLNVRNESNRQRISVNINSRLIGGIRNEKNKDFIMFMLYVEDAQNLKKQGVDLKSDFLDFKNAKELDNTQTYFLAIDELTVHEKEIYPKWLKCCSDYLPTQTSSQYRIHHIPELYELVVDKDYRNNKLNEILGAENTLDNIIATIITEPHFQKIINEQDFYLEKGRSLFQKLIAFDLSKIKSKAENLLNNFPSTFKHIELIEKEEDTDFKELLILLGNITAYCDAKAYNKVQWNEYEEKRVISKANLSQAKWVYNFLLFKLNDNSLIGLENKVDNAFKKSIEYLQNPIVSYPITSNNHRGLITEYFRLSSESEIPTLFEKFTRLVKNVENITALIANILYHPRIKKFWMESIVGIMANDSTGWQENTIKKMKDGSYNACVLWNSKRPTGTNNTIKMLKALLEDEGQFYFYYAINGLVKYRATIIDFVENQQELDKADWNSKYSHILNFSDDFTEYVDENKKASIVFLASSIEEIESLSIDDFVFYKSEKPRQDNISPIKSIHTNTIEIKNNSSSSNMEDKHPLNQILYGSPGTGKTYHTINHAVAIIESKKLEIVAQETREDIKDRYNTYVNEGKIVFTTFHQSMSYEDFIEGIKPIEPKIEGGNISYKIVDGIFKEICKKAVVRNNDIFKVLEKFKTEISEDEGKEPITIKSPTTTFDVIYKYGNVLHVSPLNTSKKEKPWYSVNIDNIISYYNTGVLTGTNQTYTREIADFLIKNRNLDRNDNSIEPSDKVPNYVIIIDEINRGNVSAIFGELITLIEESKRQGNTEALEVTLPYSKEKFSVPKNVYIIGTMNTADRSVEALDTALRRRFSFVEMQPNLQILNRFYSDWYYANFDALWNLSWNDPIWVSFEERFVSILVDSKAYTNISDKEVENFYKSNKSTKEFSNFFSSKGIKYLPVEVLRVINDRIDYLLNKDHTIGHSYFLDVKSIGDLEKSFFKNIIPLLQEYFYGDYTKMSLVIGEGFFESLKEKQKVKFAKGVGDAEIPDRIVVNLKTQWEEGEFLNAIHILLGNGTK